MSGSVPPDSPPRPPHRQASPATRLDPALRQRLLAEARTPWRGLRRALWLALSASAALGLATMAMRWSAGSEVASADLLIQMAALILFGGLLWLDRGRDSTP